MEKEIKAIKEHIKILNHNSDAISRDVGDLKKDFKEHKDSFYELVKNHAETRINVSWLMKNQRWILNTVIFGTLMTIMLGILMFFLTRSL